MKKHISNKEIFYDGSNLQSLYGYKTFDVQGESIVSFIGGCEVKEHLVDYEDRKNNDFIKSDQMVHFIIEHFDISLSEMICRQRLFISIVSDYLGQSVVRKGDDLYIVDGKLSVSIATASPVSCLIHTGINITNDGTPIKTSSLADINIDPIIFANDICKLYCNEIESIKNARSKVIGVS